MKFNKETLAGAVFVVFRVLLWLPVLAAAAVFGAALGGPLGCTGWSFSLRSICPQQLSAFWLAC